MIISCNTVTNKSLPIWCFVEQYNDQNISMMATTLFSYILVLVLFPLDIAEPQLGYSRNWFGSALRNISIDHMPIQCLPDDSPCERLTDCCSNWCHPYYPVKRCEPSRCGCPQPPWTPEPISDNCILYGHRCYDDRHYRCCTGFCKPGYPYFRCGASPCIDCE